MTREVEVCYVSIAGATQDVLCALVSQLHGEERLRAARFRRFQDRMAFATGRALVRKMLSDRACAPTGGWRFQPNAYGKPELLCSPEIPDLRFNLSHCDGLVAAALTTGCEIGIDAECVHGAVDCIEIARTCFAQQEISHLRGIAGEQRKYAFFSYWTLREARLKAQGKGFAVESSLCVFTLDPLSVCFCSEQEEQPDDWFFWRDQPSPTHMVAVATRRESGGAVICSRRYIECQDLCPNPGSSPILLAGAVTV